MRFPSNAIENFDPSVGCDVHLDGPVSGRERPTWEEMQEFNDRLRAVRDAKLQAMPLRSKGNGEVA